LAGTAMSISFGLGRSSATIKVDRRRRDQAEQEGDAPADLAPGGMRQTQHE
jgi:hypothetical protein